MAKETILYGEVKFREKSISEDLAARLLAIDANGNLVDRPAISTSTFISTSLADGRVWIGSAGGVATAVDTAAVGDIDADSVNGLTIKAGTIVDVDISGAAAIAYSKLNLAGSIVNADVSASAAITYSKLTLSNSIVNADIAAAAAITRTKIATGTAYRLVANNSAGVLSENAAITASRAVVSDGNGQLIHSTTTAAEIAFVSGLNAAVQTQLDDEIATKTVKAIVKAPTVAEHGYAITWDNATGTWDLTDPVTQGIPLGGDTRQVLMKVDGTDWNADWNDLVLTDIGDVSALVADLNLLAGAQAAGLTATHLSYLIGASSNLQSQIGSKLSNSLSHNNLFVGNASNIPTALAPGSDGQVLSVVSGVPTWQTVAASGVTTVGALDSGSKSANGASISGANIIFQTADATYPGLVSTGTQVFAGQKTFNGNVGIGVTPTVPLDVSGNAVIRGNITLGHSSTVGTGWVIDTNSTTGSVPLTIRADSITFDLSNTQQGSLTFQESAGVHILRAARTSAGVTKGFQVIADAGVSGDVHGGNFTLAAGNGYSVGNNNGGNLLLTAGTANGSGTAGYISLTTASTERVRIDGTGIGVGTTTPHAPLHFANLTGRKIIFYESADNDHQVFGISLDAPNDLQQYRVSTTIGSHVFYAATSSTTSDELMRLSGLGNLSITSTDPGATNPKLSLTADRALLALTSSGDVGSYIHLIRTGGTPSQWNIGNRISTTDLRIQNNTSGINYHFNDAGTATAVSWTSTSDRRLKEGITRVEDSQLSIISAIGSLVSHYTRKDNHKKETGFIAQELLKIAPEYVNVPQDMSDMLSVDYGRMVAPLYKGVKELTREVDELKKQITELKKSPRNT